MTYKDTLPIGSRVTVSAALPSCGSDHRFHGREGTVTKHGMWFAVKLDRPKWGWPNPVYLCPEHLRAHT